MQHPRGIPNPAGIKGHIHDSAVGCRGLTSVGILQEKRPAVIRARTAPIPLLALPGRAMSHNIRALTVGAVQYLENHETTLAFGVSLPLILISRVAYQHLCNTFLIREP